jgi:hypothetical protein
VIRQQFRPHSLTSHAAVTCPDARSADGPIGPFVAALGAGWICRPRGSWKCADRQPKGCWVGQHAMKTASWHSHVPDSQAGVGAPPTTATRPALNPTLATRCSEGTQVTSSLAKWVERITYRRLGTRGYGHGELTASVELAFLWTVADSRGATVNRWIERGLTTRENRVSRALPNACPSSCFQALRATFLATTEKVDLLQLASHRNWWRTGRCPFRDKRRSHIVAR